VVLAWSPC